MGNRKTRGLGLVALIVCAFVAAYVLAALFAVRSKAQQNDGTYPVRAGYVDMIRLFYFAPDDLDAGCEQLRTKHLSEAAPVFRAELQRQPQSLAAYVGLSQADAAFRASEIQRLRLISSQSLRPSDKFKLGLQLFYQWGTRSFEQNQTDHSATLHQATALMEQSWQKTKQPLVGCLLCEAYDMGGSIGPYLPKEAVMTRGMISGLAGPRVYAMYERAGQTGWQEAPPHTDLVPPANWKALDGVIGERWSFLSMGTSSLTIQNGKTVPGKEEHPTRNQGESDYLDHWRDVLAPAWRRRAHEEIPFTRAALVR